MNTILQDKAFLKQLMERRNRITYVRITALDLDLNIKDEIIGRATEGSINVDGASAVRRSCSLTLVTENVNINSYNWALNTRFRLEIGVKNNTALYTSNPIIWFPQGVYVITQFSAALGTGSYTISLSGQDKMCLMNGEISGQVTAETDFGQYDEIDEEGNRVTKVLTLREIILSLVHTYGLEPLDNIIIELPDDSGYNLLTYRGQDPLYLLRNVQGEQVENFTFYGNTLNDAQTHSLKTLGNYWKPKGINQEESDQNKGEIFALGDNSYYVQKIEYGEIAGYEETPLTYAGELKAAAGEAVTSVLDKIKNMLGEFEYFYDLYGVFRFQKKKTYLKTYMNEQSAIEAFTDGEYSYEFDDLSMFTSFNNNPNIKNLKNDFTVWGEYKSASGAALPIHMRLAIDKKPTSYCSPWQDKSYSTSGEDAVDWRELIYQMAIDYQSNHINPNYGELLEAANPAMVKNGRTGYEQYYTDILGFWRYLYEPDENRAIKSYRRVAANDTSVVKSYYAWQEYTDPSINSTDFPYTSWYINNGNYKILWTDSLDLTPTTSPMYYVSDNATAYSEDESEISLRRLYRFNSSTGVYSKVLDNPLIEQPYYVYERDDGDGSQTTTQRNIVDSLTWGIMEQLENLYLKKPYAANDTALPLMRKINVNQLKSNSYSDNIYRSDIYVHLNDESRPSLCNHVIYYAPTANGAAVMHDLPDIDLTSGEASWTALQNAFSRSNKVYFRQSKNDTVVDTEYNPARMSAYVIGRYKMSIQESDQYALYYKTNNNMKLYAQHLMDDGLMIQVDENNYQYQILDEMWLASIQDHEIKDLRSNIIIDRKNLYRKVGDEYIPAFELASLIDPEQTIYAKSKTLTQVTEPEDGTPLPDYESYKITKLDGEINENTPEQKRPIEYYTYVSDYNLDTHWNKVIDEAPQTLLFWFDFLDPDYYPQLAPYSVANVGTRPLVKNEKTVTAIYYPATPNVYFNDSCPLYDGSRQYFTISSQGQSAHDTIDSWLYNHTYITESVSINTIPIYYLEPNSKISINDEERNIHGDYIVDKLTIPLAYNGTMSITATKAPETF